MERNVRTCYGTVRVVDSWLQHEGQHGGQPPTAMTGQLPHRPENTSSSSFLVGALNSPTICPLLVLQIRCGATKRHLRQSVPFCSSFPFPQDFQKPRCGVCAIGRQPLARKVRLLIIARIANLCHGEAVFSMIISMPLAVVRNGIRDRSA